MLRVKCNRVAREKSNRSAQGKSHFARIRDLRMREGFTRKKQEEEGAPWGPLPEHYLCSRCRPGGLGEQTSTG